jgi:CRP-like cAMP-binding protein
MELRPTLIGPALAAVTQERTRRDWPAIGEVRSWIHVSPILAPRRSPGSPICRQALIAGNPGDRAPVAQPAIPNPGIDIHNQPEGHNVAAATSALDFNKLLATLPAAEQQHLQPDLEWVEMSPGATLYDAGTVPQYVYFPSTGIVSLVCSMQDGGSAELAMVGNEGVVGVSAFMGGGCALSRAVVHGAGHGLRMPARAIARHARRSSAVMQQLLRYTQALITQMAQTAACNRHHALDQQLCRWLLLNLDRREDNEVAVTQERIAEMLGVRRESVTGGAVKLQKAGLIQYGRGRISVLDRAGLEHAACECYSVVKQAYDRILSDWTPRSSGLGGHRHLVANEAGLQYRPT